MNILPDKYFKTVLECLSVNGSLLQLLLGHWDCLNTDISQGKLTVATYLRYSEIFKGDFVANLQLSLPAKEFWKSVNIPEIYGQEFSVLFFFDSSAVVSVLVLLASAFYAFNA